MTRRMDDVSKVWRVRLEQLLVAGEGNWRHKNDGSRSVTFYGPYASAGAARGVAARLRREITEDNMINRRVTGSPGWVEVSMDIESADAHWKLDVSK